MTADPLSYFTFNGDHWVEFTTLSDAETEAEEAIDHARDCCDPEWSSWVPEGATKGPWKWWTSNSWRRLKSDRPGWLASVLEPFVATDGHPDCCVVRENMDLIALAPELADALRAARAVIVDTEAERDRATRNRDLWRGQCERQAAQIERMRSAALREMQRLGQECDAAEYPPEALIEVCPGGGDG